MSAEEPQGVFGKVMGLIKGKSAKDKMKPKTMNVSSAAKTTSGTAPKPKRYTASLREISDRLHLSLPLRVTHRSCQHSMTRLTSKPPRSLIIQGRASALTAVAGFEMIIERILRGAIDHARARGAGTVKLLDMQRGVMVQPRVARSLRYSRIAMANSPNPLGIVGGMMIGLRNKKKQATVTDSNDEKEDDEEATVSVRATPAMKKALVGTKIGAEKKSKKVDSFNVKNRRVKMTARNTPPTRESDGEDEQENETSSVINDNSHSTSSSRATQSDAQEAVNDTAEDPADDVDF
jgi:hypothetical protein